MVKIRLFKKGSKKKNKYIIIVSDSRSPRNGKFIEKIGSYNPILKKIKINIIRFLYWKNKGACLNNVVKKIYKFYKNKICIY